MSIYQNIPGVNLELLDGNLRVDPPVSKDSVLVIGRALKGPSNRQILVTDSNIADRMYGAGSPILEAAGRARAGGAKTVIMYRIGGKPARIDGIFGEDTYIETREETVTAGDEYRIYVGPRPRQTDKACVIIFKEDRIVFSNVPGSEVDQGLFNMYGFTEGITTKIGTPTDPVLFSQVILSPRKEKLVTTSATGVLEYNLPKTKRAYNVVINSAKLNGVTVNPTVENHTAGDFKIAKFATQPDANQELVIEYTVTPVRAEQGNASFAGDSTTTDFSLPNTIKTDTVTANKVTVKNITKALTTDFTIEDHATEDKKIIKFVTAPATGEAIVIDYTVVKQAANVTGTYSPGENNINPTWKQYYEMLDQALAELETTNAVSVVTDLAIADAPNVAYGSTSADRLDFVRKVDNAGVISFEWSTERDVYKKGAGQTSDKSEADIDDNGQPILIKKFSEANFSHMLAMFAYRLSQNERFCLVTIGTSLPRSLNNYELNRWVGASAQRDPDGNIIVAGNGILGIPRLTEQPGFPQGLYATSTGFPDGDPLSDSNGALIDIGKFLSVVPAFAAAGSIAFNCASAYAGLLTTIRPGDSTTNTLMPGLTLPLAVKKYKLDELAGAGFVMFDTKARGVTVTSGELATSINSDYDYVSTTIIVADLINSIRGRLDGFIGKGLTELQISAMETAIETLIQAKVEQGSIVKYIFSVLPQPVVNGKSSVNIPITIVPPFELREVNITLKLALDL